MRGETEGRRRERRGRLKQRLFQAWNEERSISKKEDGLEQIRLNGQTPSTVMMNVERILMQCYSCQCLFNTTYQDLAITLHI